MTILIFDAALPKTSEAMAELKKTFEPVKEADDKAQADYQKALEIWNGNKKARDDAWAWWKKLLAAV